MKHTEYFDKTKPSKTQLDYTESTKTEAMLERLRAGAQLGIVAGFIVTPNAGDATKIDISAGEGYTGGFFPAEDIKGVNSGERICTIPDSGLVPGTPPTAAAVALADYTLNVYNYVTLLYAETGSGPLSERYFPGATHNTIYTETFTINVLTATQWNALTVDELAQRVLVAVVKANGAGVNLTTASITQVTPAKSHPTMTQPAVITGVIITNISAYTQVGAGTLRYVAATKNLYWTAPGDTEGTGVAITVTGSYTLYSTVLTYSMHVSVILTMLPAVDTSETITINSLYGRTVPFFSASDRAHRDMVGSGVPTVTNPHGLADVDLTGGSAATNHAGLFHVNAIAHGADTDQLECSINILSGNDISIINKGSEHNSFLINGLTFETLRGVPGGVTTNVTFVAAPALDSGDYLVYVNNDADAAIVKIGGDLAPILGDVYLFWSDFINLYDMQNTIVGNGIISWDAAARTLTYQSPGDAGPGAAVRVLGEGPTSDPSGYYKLFSVNTDDWVIVRVTGDLGATNSTTFVVAMDATTHPEKLILKLAIVYWDRLNTSLGNFRDIRSYQRMSADNKDQVNEEHDASGYHTKPLRNQLRIAVASNGLFVQAETNSAIVGTALSYGVVGAAANSAIYGAAATAKGVGGSAPNSGVYGLAATAQGIYGSAPNTGIYGIAATAQGIYGSAKNSGIYGIAATAQGIAGSAPNSAIYGTAGTYAIAGRATYTAIYGTADSVGAIYGTALNNAIMGSARSMVAIEANASEAAVWANATNTGVYATALTNYGVQGLAATYGVYGSAAYYGVYGIVGGSYGVYGQAATSGVYGTAALYGVNGVAANTGVYGSAATIIGVYGSAQAYFGLYGRAANSAVYGIALTDVGIFGVGANTGVYGTAAIVGGVVGSAPNSGIYGSAATVGGVIGYAAANSGVYGTAAGVGGIVGYAANSGIYGTAAGVGGVVGSAPNSGIYGLAAAAYGVHGVASAIGVIGSATNTGVYGTAAGSIGVAGYAANVGVYASGAAVCDLSCAHGSAVPAINFAQVAGHTGGGVAVNGIIVVAGGATVLLPLFATA